MDDEADRILGGKPLTQRQQVEGRDAPAVVVGQVALAVVAQLQVHLAVGGRHGVGIGHQVDDLTSSLKKYVFYNCLINNVLYLRVT